jgi:hypothetical protein
VKTKMAVNTASKHITNIKRLVGIEAGKKGIQKVNPYAKHIVFGK